MIIDVRINIIFIQIVNKIDQLLNTVGIIAHLHCRLEFFIPIIIKLFQLGGQIIEFIQTCVFSQFVSQAINIAVIIRNKPFLICTAKLIFWPDTNSFKYVLQFFRCGRKLHPFSDQLTLVVFTKVCDVSFKRAIVVITIWHLIFLLYSCIRSSSDFGAAKKRHTHHFFRDELTLYSLSIFFCKRETNERLFLRFMSHLSMIILSQPKTEKKIRTVSSSLVFC